MLTEIFYGDFGTGKTAEMYREIKAAAEKKERCILFVPEQFSFDTERAAYFAVGAKNIRYVRVTGFSKLSRDILNLYKAARPCADNAVKLITMWKTIDNAKADFLSLGKSKNSPGLCTLMLKTVSAFKNAGISPKDCQRLLENEGELDEDLSDKAGDFLRIYADYDKALTESLDDKLDDVSRAAELADKNGYFKGCRLFFDNYDSFSLVQKKMLSVALSQCDKATVCLSCDTPQSRKREFICVAKTVEEIKTIDPDTRLRLFPNAYRKKARGDNSVKLFSAKTPYDEAELIAAEIHRSVREEGARYRDFLILTADGEYEEIIGDRLKRGDIPVFCDFPHSMTEKPIVNFVTLILKATELEAEDILNLAECGYLRIRDFDEEGGGGEPRLIYSKEAYSLRCAAESYEIDRADFEKGFENDPRRELAELEGLRKGIVEPLAKLKETLDGAADGTELSALFMEYLLEEQKIQSAFIAASKSDMGGEVHTIEIDENAAEENGRIWDALCEAFTSMAYCLENKKISIEDYRLLLEEILSGINLANPPKSLDNVTLGDIERTRKTSPKTVIIAGFNEGSIPRGSHFESIFTDDECESLNKVGFSVYDSKLNRHSKEYFFAERAMSLYERKLIITMCCQDAAGREAAPSSILSAEEFKNLTIASKEEMPPEYFINTRYDLRCALSSYWGGDEKVRNELLKLLWGLDDKEYGEKVSEALTLLSGGRDFSLPPSLAAELFGNAAYSPTSLEAAFDCPFMYFGQYGLGLRENNSADLEKGGNKGTVIHNIMRRALSSGSDIADMSGEEIELLAKKSVEEETEQYIRNNPTFPERARALLGFMLPQIIGILKQVSLELKQGSYKPSEFEKKVEYKIWDERLREKCGSDFITVKGTADRIDICAEQSKEKAKGGAGEYVRIIDYKSGKKPKKFSLNDVGQGADLQMLLYLFAECGGEKNGSAQRLPGGIGYFNAGAPSSLSAASSLSVREKDLDKEWYNSHIISGAVFDGNGELAMQAKKYNQAVTEKTEGRASDKYYSVESLSYDSFAELKSYIERDVIVNKVISLLDGEIKALPLERSDGLPCDFCSFSSICANKGKNVRTAEDGGDMNKFRIKPSENKGEGEEK